MVLRGSALIKIVALMGMSSFVIGCGDSSGAGGAPAPITAEQKSKTDEMLKNYPKINADMAKERRAAAAAGKK